MSPVRHAELVVLGDHDVGRVERARRALGVAQHLVGAERLLERVVREEPSGEGRLRYFQIGQPGEIRSCNRRSYDALYGLPSNHGSVEKPRHADEGHRHQIAARLRSYARSQRLSNSLSLSNIKNSEEKPLIQGLFRNAGTSE